MLFTSVFGEQWTTGLLPDRQATLPQAHALHFILSRPVMAENLRFLRALQRIADTTRRVNQNPRPRPTIQVTPSILRSLPEHRPLLPLLLSHNIPSEHARICSERYAEYASKLRSEMEAKLVSYLTDRKERRPARVYSLFLNNYSQALQLWSQSILNTALKNLKRDSVELQNLEVTYPAPLWLSVRPIFQHLGARLTIFQLPPVQVFSHSKSNVEPFHLYSARQLLTI